MHALVGTLGWVGLGLFAFGPGTALLFLLLTNLGLAFGDVIVVRIQFPTAGVAARAAHQVLRHHGMQPCLRI